MNCQRILPRKDDNEKLDDVRTAASNDDIDQASSLFSVRVTVDRAHLLLEFPSANLPLTLAAGQQLPPDLEFHAHCQRIDMRTARMHTIQTAAGKGQQDKKKSAGRDLLNIRLPIVIEAVAEELITSQLDHRVVVVVDKEEEEEADDDDTSASGGPKPKQWILYARCRREKEIILRVLEDAANYDNSVATRDNQGMLVRDVANERECLLQKNDKDDKDMSLKDAVKCGRDMLAKDSAVNMRNMVIGNEASCNKDMLQKDVVNSINKDLLTDTAGHDTAMVMKDVASSGKDMLMKEAAMKDADRGMLMNDAVMKNAACLDKDLLMKEAVMKDAANHYKDMALEEAASQDKNMVTKDVASHGKEVAHKDVASIDKNMSMKDATNHGNEVSLKDAASYDKDMLMKDAADKDLLVEKEKEEDEKKRSTGKVLCTVCLKLFSINFVPAKCVAKSSSPIKFLLITFVAFFALQLFSGSFWYGKFVLRFRKSISIVLPKKVYRAVIKKFL
jgi:hypothetical protein